ncbi:MGMT family protein [Streptomyces sp. TRM 70351]|uniref:MGMT family protein n=1 Tax=Streptomyces sp. TRM 70351 TaxID=3116552 RepID=UPI002E7C1071|nr:MGMT family protein [Streptomyces sp. TRM 70351]MEE1927694.1 MGMT family protein [Streptomyces sp. TRM 70351]
MAPMDGAAEEPDRLPEYAERVLEVAGSIPPGRVLTYGDIARWLREEREEQEGREAAPDAPSSGARPGGGGPRQVGRVMALYGGAVPWWRVVRADGVPLPGQERRALARYRAEGTPLRVPAGVGARPRVDLRRARWDGAPPD